MVVIPFESWNMTSPHLDSWVILPSVAGQGERLDYLQGFDALLAESPVVKASEGCVYVRTWNERLHLFSPLKKECKRHQLALLLHAA